MELTLYQVIAILNNIETKDKQFYRVGDKDFKIFKEIERDNIKKYIKIYRNDFAK